MRAFMSDLGKRAGYHWLHGAGTYHAKSHAIEEAWRVLAETQPAQFNTDILIGLPYLCQHARENGVMAFQAGPVVDALADALTAFVEA